MHSSWKSFLFLLFPGTLGFLSPSCHHLHSKTLLNSDRFNRDINERSQERAQGQAGGEMAAGAILGGLIGGPFGLLFGAQIGANLGAKNAMNRAREDEMKRMGITQDMLDAAEECGLALEQSMEGLKATEASLETHQALARRLDRDTTGLYEKAKEAMLKGDEEQAKKYLLERKNDEEKLKKILKLCADDKQRLEMMQKNVDVIEKRALEVQALLQRTVGAKARQDSTFDMSVPTEDPLLKKFRDLGID